MFKVSVKIRRGVFGVVSAALLASGGAARSQAVTLRAASDGVVAEYVLPASARTLTFADKGVVRTDWRAEAVTLAADGVTAPAPVTRFSLRLLSDTTESDRGYIALTRVAEGYVL